MTDRMAGSTDRTTISVVEVKHIVA